MPTVGAVVAGLTSSAGQANVERKTAMWPLSAAPATRLPAPAAMVRNPVGVTTLSFSLLVTLWFDFQLLTASVFPEPTTPANQFPYDSPPSGSPSRGLVMWLVSFPSRCA